MRRAIASACRSSSARWSATPERRVCTSPPPSSSAADDLAGRGLHQRRAAEEDRALVLDDDGLVAHRRHVGAAGGARAHHDRDLRDALRAHVGLVEEDAAEVLAVGEDLVLVRQVGAAGVDQVDARQAVLLRDLLRAQVLLHRHRVVGAALHRRVVGDDHAVVALDPADAGDHARAGRLAVVHAVGGELADLEERRARVEQAVDAVARQQLAARRMALARLGVAAERDLGRLGAQVVDLRCRTRRCCRNSSERVSMRDFNAAMVSVLVLVR